MTGVAKMMPNPSEIAMGIRNCAEIDVSKIMGASPKNVVSAASTIGRNRLVPACRAAWGGVSPASAYRLAVTTSTRPPLTTTPHRAMMPKTLMMLRS